SAPLRKLLGWMDGELRGFEQERSELEVSLRALTSLLQRAQGRDADSSKTREERRARAARAARRLSRALDKSRIPVLQLSADLRVLRGNAAAAALCGVAQDQLQGPIFELIEPLEAEAVKAKWLRKLARGEPAARTLACTVRGGRTLA